jgi:hypothetical protein
LSISPGRVQPAVLPVLVLGWGGLEFVKEEKRENSVSNSEDGTGMVVKTL